MKEGSRLSYARKRSRSAHGSACRTTDAIALWRYWSVETSRRSRRKRRAGMRVRAGKNEICSCRDTYFRVVIKELVVQTDSETPKLCLLPMLRGCVGFRA
uniref:Uncharacterized protein n=1 Tax=Hyaloperonospora arabidopsidis (strain Emoy2) TaxID=559515 RepID=M4B7I6_HYAAE